MNSKLNLDDILRKLKQLKQLIEQNLAPRITNIETYLSTLTERVQNGSVIVTGNLQTEQITPLNISESELVQVYNDIPKVLLKNSIIAELTAKSYREDKKDHPLFLENDENGKYWIIVSNQNNIFLVPSINIKLHIHKLKTVAKLFDFHGVTASVDTHFVLTKPAKVSSLPNGKEWKLEEKGILEFSDPFLEFKPVLDITDDIKIQEIINQLKHPMLVEAIKNIISEYYQPINNQIITQHQQEDSYVQLNIDLTLQEQELVNLYKDTNFDFQKFIIKVSESKESQTKRWNGSNETPIFKHNRRGRGDYWIVNMDNSLYIVPQRNFRINEYNQNILTLVFECRNYQSGKVENFILIKPGKVTLINEDEWQVQVIEQGIIECQ